MLLICKKIFYRKYAKIAFPENFWTMHALEKYTNCITLFSQTIKLATMFSCTYISETLFSKLTFLNNKILCSSLTLLISTIELDTWNEYYVSFLYMKHVSIRSRIHSYLIFNINIIMMLIIIIDNKTFCYVFLWLEVHMTFYQDYNLIGTHFLHIYLNDSPGKYYSHY